MALLVVNTKNYFILYCKIIKFIKQVYRSNTGSKITDSTICSILKSTQKERLKTFHLPIVKKLQGTG